MSSTKAPISPLAFICIMACCFPFIPCLQAVFLTEAYRRKRANDPKKVSRRRRKLSTSARFASNVDCHLLRRLPIELRLEIYTYVLGGNLLHIFQVPKRLAHKCCHTTPSKGYFRSCCPTTQRINVRKGYPGPFSSANTAILRTCRQIYLEAINVLYTTNIFDIDHLQTLLYLSKSIPHQHFATISTLHVSWPVTYHAISFHGQVDGMNDWERFCHVVATKMPGLRHFKVSLTHSAPLSIHEESDQDWIKPLLEIQGLMTFNLVTHDVNVTRRHETNVNAEILKLQLCLRELLCTEPPASPPGPEANGSKLRKLRKPPKPPNLADVQDGRMIEMTQVYDRASNRVEAESSGRENGSDSVEVR